VFERDNNAVMVAYGNRRGFRLNWGVRGPASYELFQNSAGSFHDPSDPVRYVI